MNKLQMTTTGGIATLVASVTKFCELFGDYKIIKIKDAFLNIPLQGFFLAIIGISASIYLMMHNEDIDNEKP